MKSSYRLQKIPKTRIATFDTFAIGLLKHHISALLEFDVTDARSKLRKLRKNGIDISFNAWLIKVISNVLQKHPVTAAYVYNKKRLMIFDNIVVSTIIEKKVRDSKVPIPFIIENANEKSSLEITREIENAKGAEFSENNIVLEKESALYERLYYLLPGFLRRIFWKILLRYPKSAYKKMGNVMITSVGMAGKINGWFVHRSVHPISFGIGSILRKPVVIENEIRIREILNMTILVDHDLVDGAPMVRFLNDLTYHIETGKEINCTND